jgi:hypothetical protein
MATDPRWGVNASSRMAKIILLLRSTVSMLIYLIPVLPHSTSAVLPDHGSKPEHFPASPHPKSTLIAVRARE